MDELILDEKRYVSSKRAAKITGYAKDYIGQLCREGRVPARLVGRSWYVLESAIQDHRFGTQAGKKESSYAKEIEESVAVLTKKWESPRYEAVEAAEIPQVTKKESVVEGVGAIEESLKDAWQAWFDHISTGFGSAEPIKAEIEPEEPKSGPTEEVVAPEDEVKVPIRAIYQPALKAPPARQRRSMEKEIDEVMEEVHRTHEEPRPEGRKLSISIMAGAVAVLALLVGVIGSGRFDKYVISYKPASFFAGVALYNK